MSRRNLIAPPIHYRFLGHVIPTNGPSNPPTNVAKKPRSQPDLLISVAEQTISANAFAVPQRLIPTKRISGPFLRALITKEAMAQPNVFPRLTVAHAGWIGNLGDALGFTTFCHSCMLY